MRILFLLKHPGSTRNFESTLRALAERGHELRLAFDSTDGGSANAIVERLQADFPNVSVSRSPKAGKDEWRSLARGLRLGIDYLRYLEPRYANSIALRMRAERWAPGLVREVSRLRLVGSPTGVALFARALRAVERAVPTPPTVDEFIRAQAPDILLVTPLVGLGSTQAEYVRSAQKLGVPAGLLVHSWDNLTNKGLLRDAPDLVAVWNETQAREAVGLHGVPPERVVVTGAAAYDHWFEWAPSRTREDFAAEVELRADRPIVLYLCSSPFIAPDETRFVRRWIEGLRAAGGVLADAGIVVRPHPQNAAQWQHEPLGDHEQVSVWPPEGADPVNEAARTDYYDSMHHAAAVVGINTTALIESAIVGRPVLTLLSEEFASTQTGTLHFSYLVDVGGGALTVATTMAEHVVQLTHALTAGDGARARPFVEAFVRPFGLDRPAAPELVAAVERLRDVRPARARPALTGRIAASLLAAAVRRRHPPASAESTQVARSSPNDPLHATRRTVKELSRRDVPVLAGPYLGEVGYELLYWIPFLAWATRCHPELTSRLVAISRGGTQSWYGGLARHYAELYELLDPEELRDALADIAYETRGYRKQYGVTTLDRELLDKVAASLGIDAYETLHPSEMFTAYRTLAKQGALQRKDTIFEFRPIDPPPLGELANELPGEYVAVRFYFSAAFPDLPENRRFVSSTVAALGRSAPVVLLSPGTTFDDHLDPELHDAGWLHRLDHLMTPSDNLGVQTSVVARARAFVGTYGGLSYLGPLVGVPTVAFYSDPARFRPQHLEAAQRAFREPPFGRFSAVDIAQADLLRDALGDRLVAFHGAR